MFYPVISALSAALAAGNCIIVEVTLRGEENHRRAGAVIC
jgi:hypothetical protein